MILSQLFDRSLVSRRNEPALEWSGTTFTFGEIDLRSNRMANLLLRRGLRKGDRLAVVLPNRIEMIDLFLACAKSGIVFVPINILYREREIEPIVRDAEPALVIREPDVEALSRDSADASTDRPSIPLRENDPVGIIYTSGTTGTSKGAVLSHRNFAANARNLVDAWRITDRDRFLLALPLFHVHGLGNGIHCWLASGCRMRLLPRFDHETASAVFIELRPTLFFGVPTMYVRLLDWPDAIASEIGASMRLFVSGSAALPAHVFGEFERKFGHAILERYGMSETLMNLSNPYAGERRPGTVGLPLPGVSIRLHEGELVVRGPNVFSGYWRRDDATREAFVDGDFRTGDLATVSDDGYYTLQGRRSDLIISGGFNIDPREIEELLAEQEGIVEAAVVGVPHETRGEVPIAYVVTRGDLDETLLERVCRESLASFKLPRRFIRVGALPRNALGKVQKHLLSK